METGCAQACRECGGLFLRALFAGKGSSADHCRGGLFSFDMCSNRLQRMSDLAVSSSSGGAHMHADIII